MANGEGHKILTHAALMVQDEWIRRILSPVMQKLENEYCMYGDDYFRNPEEIGPYIEMPGGRLPMDPWEIRHFRKDAPGKDYYTCGYYGLMRDVFEYFAGKCIDSMKNGNADDFAKFVGSISHVIEDCGAPPHAVGTEMGTDMKLIKQLYPSADSIKMACQFHSVLERGYEPFDMKYAPKLLGCSPSEISFNMFERFTDMIENSISFIIPMLNAFYRSDDKHQAWLLTECGRFSSEIVADFIYSTASVGTGRIDASQKLLLDSIFANRLTPVERTAWVPFPYPYAEIRKAPWNLDGNCSPVSLSLLVNGHEKNFEEGFGIGAPFEMTYMLPSEVYAGFESIVGISSKLGAEAPCEFAVHGDDSKLASVKCGAPTDTQIIKCNISGVKKLTLKTVFTGDNQWLGNSHFVWGNPRFLK